MKHQRRVSLRALVVSILTVTAASVGSISSNVEASASAGSSRSGFTGQHAFSEFRAAKPTLKPQAKSTKPPAKKTTKATKVTKVAASVGTRPPVPVEIKETWSLKDTLDGWARVDDQSWPASGRALGVEARANSIAVRQNPSVASPGLLFAREKWMAQPVTFLAIRDYGEWVQVQLPVRPNGTLGWVRGAEVSRIAITTRIVVDLSTNVMYVENNGRQIARHPVSPGTGDTPTPTGLFYVRALIVQANAAGPYGPYVWGLSGYSEVLNEFDGGAAGIAIHGTNQPGAIGSPASHGCVRLTNDIVTSLTKFLPLGTPVEIVKSLADLPTQRKAMAEPEPDPIKPEQSQPGLVIDFPLQPVGIPERHLEEFDIVDVTA